MKKSQLKRTVKITLVLLLLVLQSNAQKTGRLEGVVTDSQSGDMLPYANLYINEIALGTTTDLNGAFSLNNVPIGAHVIEISYLGYESKNEMIAIQAGETTKKNFDLILEGVTTETIIVSAQASGQRAAINQQLAALTITNVVSAEKIRELPDATAAEAIGRLPGISLQRDAGEANKVVIRGLSPRYNAVTLEGIRLASTNDFDRSVDLSLIQSELVGGIEVSKSLRADMDADALGGTVNFRLAEAPSKAQYQFIAEGGYAGLTNDFNNYRVLAGASNRFFDGKLGASFKASYEQKQLPSHRFNAGYSGIEWSFETDTDNQIVDSTLNIRTENATLVDREQTRRRTNINLILDYKNDWWKVKFLNLVSQKNDLTRSRENTYFFKPSGGGGNFQLNASEADWRVGSRTHSLQNEFTIGNISRLQLTLSHTYATRITNTQNFPFRELSNFGINENDLIYALPENLLESVGGPEALNIGNTFLQQFGITDSDLTDVSYDAKLDYEIDYRLSRSISGTLRLGGKYHELTRTSNADAIRSSFQYGGVGSSNRQAIASQFPWLSIDSGTDGGLGAASFIDKNYSSENFLNGRYELGWTANIDTLTSLQSQYYTEENDPKYGLDGFRSFNQDYEASERLLASYIMTELNIGKKLILLPGIRFERNETNYSAFHIKRNSGESGINPNPDSVTVNRQNGLWFPSLNLKFKATDKLSIQGAVYKSATRPSFRQISPLVIYPSSSNRVTSNNPYLEPATAWNFDLGFSVKTAKLGLFTAYGFYKEIDDLIFNMNQYRPRQKKDLVEGPEDLGNRLIGPEYYDESFVQLNMSTNLPFNNTEKAYVRGVELSWQTNFWYLPGALQGLVLDINYSIISSRTDYPFFKTVQIGVDNSGIFPIPIEAQQYETRSGQLQDQPSSILNIILGWDYKGFSSRISYRFQNKTLQSLDTRYSVFDRFYDTFSIVDVTLRQKINEQFAVYVNFKNINNQIDDYFIGAQKDKPALLTQSQSYGFRAQFGVRANL